MSVPSMEELVEMFIDGDGLQDVKSGLLAVLDRLKPVVAEAHACGQRDISDGAFYEPHAHDYATRIIDQIKRA